MVICCERCSTLYELDEALLGPDGAPVQCTKCSHVFTARPPSRAAPTPGPAPEQTGSAPGLPDCASAAPTATAAAAPRVDAAPPPSPAVRAVPRAFPAPAASRPTPAPARTAAEVRSAPPKAPVRPSPAVYRPTPAQAAATANPVGVRQPVVKRDAVGVFESRLRTTARLKRLAPAVVLGVAALAFAAWFYVSNRVDEGAVQLRREALALLALDDVESLERAAALLGDAARREPKLEGAAADRALALALEAGTFADERDALETRAAALRAELDRLGPVDPAAGDPRAAALSAELDRVGADARDRDRKARARSEPAFAALRELESRRGLTPEVERAFAVASAVVNDAAQVQRFAAAASAGDADPFLGVAQGMLAVHEPGGAGNARALATLGAVAARHPEVLRARLLLARAQAAAGHGPEAVATLDRVLAANPAHEAARRLKAELLAPPPVHAVEANVPAEAPPEGKPGLLPRKPSTQSHPAGAAPASAGSAAATATVATPEPPPTASATPSEPPPAAPTAQPTAPPAEPARPPPEEHRGRRRAPEPEEPVDETPGGG